MKRYAKIADGVVLNVVESAAPVLNWVECEGVSPGWRYEDGAFLAPVAQVHQRITVGAFFDRFGAAKWGILADANPLVQAVIKDASVRAYIDLTDPQLALGVDLLLQAGHVFDSGSVINPVARSDELVDYRFD